MPFAIRSDGADIVLFHFCHHQAFWLKPMGPTEIGFGSKNVSSKSESGIYMDIVKQK